MLLFILLKLTLQEVIADIPHDAGSVVVYAMLALFIGFIIHGSRRSASNEPPARDSDHV